MAEFDMKLIPKDKADLTKFINFQIVESSDFKKLNGKIVYLNANNPDTHIYEPYFMSGAMAHLLSYPLKDSPKSKTPLITLQELQYEDHIIFYTHEDIEKIKTQKNTNK